MNQPPLKFLEAAASVLALAGVLTVLGFLVVFKLPITNSGQHTAATTAAASLAPAYDEAKALSAGFEQNTAGKQLFANNCKQCHAVNEVVVGPALGNVTSRRSKEWLLSFIRNSSKLIQEGDPVAKGLFEQYNRTQMPSFNFSDEEIQAILSHIEFETAAYGM